MEINDYYKILGLKYKFTAFELLNRYFKSTKLSFETNNKEEFKKVRMGFEVLRDYKATEEYNRIYRKYILLETLNFPMTREHQMMDVIQARENLGTQIAEQVYLRQETFSMHKFKFILRFILLDLIRIFDFGGSGVLFICVGLVILLQFQNQTTIIGGILMMMMGLYLLRRNIKSEIMLN